MSEATPSPIRIAVEAALMVVGVALAVALARQSTNAIMPAVVGAVAMSLLAERAGISLARFDRRAAARFFLGGAMGTSVAGVVLLGAASRGADLALIKPTLSTALATVETLAIAYRDEMWLHGIALATAARLGWLRRGDRHRLAPLGLAVAASLAAAVGFEPDPRAAGLGLVAVSAAVFVALWVRSGDGWAAIGASFAWFWWTEVAFAGDLFFLADVPGVLTAGPRADGFVGGVAIGGFGIALGWLLRGRWPLPREDPPS